MIRTMDVDGIDESEGFGGDSKAESIMMWEVAKGMTFEGW